MVYIPPASNALDFELNAYVVPAADALDFTLDYEQGEGAVLEDMQLDINLIQDTLEDAKLDLSVYYESYDIVFPLDVLTWAEIAEDNKFDLFSAYESFDILPLNLQFSSEVTRDTILDIYLRVLL